jgi:predicted nucleic acid-binding protein
MTGRILLDTNVLVYLYDRSEPVKQERALAVLDELAALGAGFISTQVLGEMFIAFSADESNPDRFQ